MHKSKHVVIPIKVNAMIDEAIVPLVLALNTADCIFTVDSCQGNTIHSAYVFFKYSGPLEDESKFFFQLATEIGRNSHPEIEYEFQLEWRAGNTEPMGVLRTAPNCIDRLAKIVASAISSILRVDNAD